MITLSEPFKAFLIFKASQIFIRAGNRSLERTFLIPIARILQDYGMHLDKKLKTKIDKFDLSDTAIFRKLVGLAKHQKYSPEELFNFLSKGSK